MKCFISYSRKNTQIAEEITQALKILSHECTRDVNHSFIGKEFWDRICLKIRNHDIIIAIISEDYNLSNYCITELQYAKDLNKYIFPVILSKKAIRTCKVDLQEIEGFDYKMDDPFDNCVDFLTAFKKIKPKDIKPLPIPEPPVPENPGSKLKPLFEKLKNKNSFSYEEQQEIMNMFSSNFNLSGNHQGLLSFSNQFLKRNLDPRISSEMRRWNYKLKLNNIPLRKKIMKKCLEYLLVSFVSIFIFLLFLSLTTYFNFFDPSSIINLIKGR